MTIRPFPEPAELATRLVHAAGDPDAMAAMVAEDATWWISPAMAPEVMASFSTGREVIRGNLQRVFGDLYDTSALRVTVHNAISDGNTGAIRFSMAGKFSNGVGFENEYSMWVESSDDLITKVWEYVDVAQTTAQLLAAGLTSEA